MDSTARQTALQGPEQRRAAEHAVLRALASCDGIETAGPQILVEVCGCGGWALGELWMVDPRAGALTLERLWHGPAAERSEFVVATRVMTFPPGVGLPGRVWSSRAPAWVEDVVTDPNFPRAPLAAKAGLHAAFAFPIKLRDEVLGVMCFYSPEFRAPDVDLLESLEVLGGQIGGFVARQRERQALAASEARWQRVFAGAPIGIFHARASGGLLDVNPALAEMLGYHSPEELLERAGGSSLAEALLVDPARGAELTQRLRDLRGSWMRTEVACRGRDGDELTGDLHAKLVDEYQGEPSVVEGFVADITDRKRMEEALNSALERVRELTLRDHLTGLYNRRHLEQRLTVELAAARRNHDDLAVVALDIDHFKAINDRHGHASGDAVLQMFASALASAARPEDVLARLGGEEFLLLMRQATCREALATAEHLRRTIEQTVMPVPTGTLRITVSAGVASIGEGGEPGAQRLMRLADERLYAAKERGRNRVVGPD